MKTAIMVLCCILAILSTLATWATYAKGEKLISAKCCATGAVAIFAGLWTRNQENDMP